MTQEPKKEETPVGPKKILEELERSAAAPEPDAGPSPDAGQASAPVEPAAAAAPLITDAMRRLDELLARFRGSGAA